MADTHCQNCKLEVRTNKQQCSPDLEDAVNKFVERRGDLADRRRYLTDKVSTLERSIPALMAFNMWMSGQKCEDAPLCKIREIVNKFSPYPGPTEKLLADLKKTVQDLNQEITELHEKIITADVDLEEHGMELESLELSNKEMEVDLETLEKAIRAETTISLHSIHSEDLICLTRIRQLGEEERSLKCCIKQLEDKEMAYRKQMESLLISKEFQNSMGGVQMAKRLKELEINDRKWRCTYQTQKYNMHQMKKKLVEKEQELARLGNQSRVSQVASATGSVPPLEENQDYETGDDDPPLINKRDWTSWKNKTSSGRSNCPPRSCCVPLSKMQNSEKKSCHCNSTSRSGNYKQNVELTKTKLCADNPLCQKPLCDRSSASCPPIASSFAKGRSCLPNHQPTYKNCALPPCKTGCKYACKGKCARGKSENPCECGTAAESNYQPKAKNRNTRNLKETSSEDEFCECDCGCNDEDDPGSCLMK